MRWPIVTLAALVLASCGGAPKGPPPDQALELSLSAGDEAMALRRPADAVRDYRDAYRQALARDDAEAIGTAGTDLVIALTADEQPEAALALSGTVRDALGRRRTAAPFELDLAEAAALLRLDRAAEAETAAARAKDAPSPEVVARAAFLRGLAAARQGETDQLAAALARLGADGTSLTWQGDRAELDSRLQLAEGQARVALKLAQEAARLRRLALDYRGMRRALRFASVAAWRAGDTGLAAALARQADESARADQTPALPRAPLGQRPLQTGRVVDR